MRRDQHLQEQPPEQRRKNLDAQKVVRSARTDMKPMRAPRCRRVAAILSVVSADALNSRS